jgi:hypothetical protein
MFTRLFLTAVLALTPVAVQQCNKKDGTPKTPEQIEREKEGHVEAVATGLVVAAEVVENGIPVVRAFRIAGELSPDRSLSLARVALDFNNAERAAVEFMLAQDAPGAGDLHSQLSALIDQAQKLQAAGTFHLKSGRAQIIFMLSTTAAYAALRIAVGRLKDAPGAFRIRLTDGARANLRRALETIRRNDAALREAIRDLEAIVGRAEVKSKKGPGRVEVARGREAVAR